MLTLVIGGAASGKSQVAEDLCLEVARSGHACVGREPYPLIYLATMPDDRSLAARGRIARHRALREGRGFQVAEVPRDFGRKLAGRLPQGGCAVLLEGLGTLAANELFSDDGTLGDPDRALGRVLADLEVLIRVADDVVVVTDDVFREVPQCPVDEGTGAYLRVLAAANRACAERADQVAEVVCGIPVWRKGGGGHGKDCQR